MLPDQLACMLQLRDLEGARFWIDPFAIMAIEEAGDGFILHVDGAKNTFTVRDNQAHRLATAMELIWSAADEFEELKHFRVSESRPEPKPLWRRLFRR